MSISDGHPRLGPLHDGRVGGVDGAKVRLEWLPHRVHALQASL